MEIDRTYSGMIRDALASRRVKMKGETENWKIRLILDKYSSEIFLNDGIQVFSTTFYTPLDADEIHLICDGAAVVNIEKHRLGME